MSKPHLIIIGSGMACGRLLDELVQRNAQQYQISVVGEEPAPNYNRIMLSPLLAGELSAEDIVLNSEDWYQAHQIHLYKGERVVAINRIQRCLLTDAGTELHYDHLVFATGSRPAVVPTPGQHLENIFSFRTLEDVSAILHSARTARNAIVIGGGLLGLEAAYGLATKGVNTTVINRAGHLLNRQLDKTAGNMLAETLAERGIHARLDEEVSCFHGAKKVTSITLGSGEIIPADLVIIAVGITPNTELAAQASLACDRGIIVDEHLLTSDPHISALGECIEFQQETFGLVAPIWDQARLLADRLVFGVTHAYSSAPTPTKLKVSGVDLFSAGKIDADPQARVLLLQDPAKRVYRKLILNNQRLTGIVLFGDVQDGNWYFDLMMQQTDLSDWLPTLLLGQSFCTLSTGQEQQHQPEKALTGASL